MFASKAEKRRIEYLKNNKDKEGETVCIHGNNRPLECKLCQWAYGSGPKSLADNEDV